MVSRRRRPHHQETIVRSIRVLLHQHKPHRSRCLFRWAAWEWAAWVDHPSPHKLRLRLRATCLLRWDVVPVADLRVLPVRAISVALRAISVVRRIWVDRWAAPRWAA